MRVFLVNSCVEACTHSLVCQEVYEGFAAWVSGVGCYYVGKADDAGFSVGLLPSWQ